MPVNHSSESPFCKNQHFSTFKKYLKNQRFKLKSVSLWQFPVEEGSPGPTVDSKTGRRARRSVAKTAKRPCTCPTAAVTAPAPEIGQRWLHCSADLLLSTTYNFMLNHGAISFQSLHGNGGKRIYLTYLVDVIKDHVRSDQMIR